MAQPDWPQTITQTVIETHVEQIPVPVAAPDPLNKRERIAAIIAGGIWSNQFAWGPIGEGSPKKIAEISVCAADALIAALAKSPPAPMPSWDPKKL